MAGKNIIAVDFVKTASPIAMPPMTRYFLFTVFLNLRIKYIARRMNDVMAGSSKPVLAYTGTMVARPYISARKIDVRLEKGRHDEMRNISRQFIAETIGLKKETKNIVMKSCGILLKDPDMICPIK